jgi:hypothetical protein
MGERGIDWLVNNGRREKDGENVGGGGFLPTTTSVPCISGFEGAGAGAAEGTEAGVWDCPAPATIVKERESDEMWRVGV